MKKWKVGGLPPFSCKTLQEALDKASHDDTIVLCKNITESVIVSKNLIIEGNGHTWTVEDTMSGVKTEGVDLVLDNITFRVGNRANAINADGDLSLNKIKINMQAMDLRAIYSAVVHNNGNVSAVNCDLKLVTTGELSKGNFDSCLFTGYYDYGWVHTKSRTDASYFNGEHSFNDCQLSSVVVSESANATFNSCTVNKYLDIDGQATFHDLTVLNDVPEETKAYRKRYKKQPQDAPFNDKVQAKYSVAIGQGAKVNINEYRVDKVSEIQEYHSFIADHGSVNIENVNNTINQTSHLLINSSVTFTNSIDDNYWILDSSSVSLVNSRINTSQAQESALEKLNNMIGLDTVKAKINTIMNTIKMNSESSGVNFGFAHHMIFAGEPGTGKTTVAKIVAEALFEVGAISENKLTEVTVDTLIKGYVGQTANNVRNILDNARGGVVFIDEAYMLADNGKGNSFNGEALSVLIRYMEDYRDDLVVIAAGYSKEMQQFLASNPGLERRFQWVEFEDYSDKEMTEIFEQIRQSYGDNYEDERLVNNLPAAFNEIINANLSVPDLRGHYSNGGNGGLVRNIYQSVIESRNNRVIESNGTPLILGEDLNHGFDQEFIKFEARINAHN